MDVHPMLVDLMGQRGVKETLLGNITTLDHGRWDTIAFLMDTIGLVGTLTQLRQLLLRLHDRLNPGGQLLLNAESVMLMDDEPNSEPWKATRYPGELELRMRYEDNIGERFDWLYVDIDTLVTCASDCGWHTHVLLMHEDTGHYLARLLPAGATGHT